MWFTFGFVSFIGFFVWQYRKKRKSLFKGDIAHEKGQEYIYRVQEYKSTPQALYIGIQTKLKYEFSLKHESWLDRFFKALGLSKEFQVGDSAFDDKVYISSDDKAFHKHLKEDKVLADALLTIFNSSHVLYTIKELHLSNGRLWIKYKCDKEFKNSTVWDIAELVLPELSKIVESLTQVPARKINHWKDPHTLKAVVILAFSSALLINGIVSMAHIWWLDFPMTIDRSELFWDALRQGSIFTFILVLMTIMLLGRSAKTHLVILELITVGYLGSISSTYTFFRDSNMDLDSSKIWYIHTQVTSTTSSHSRKGGTHYYLYVRDYDGSFNKIKMEVSKKIWAKSKRNTRVSLKVHDGSREYRWIESFKLGFEENF